eukprot:TRINITY_DN1733_c0_g1_i2.p1 TRINITY_DN1733_c0_g1~~TRINITY_DN1733_c0_g1_i2.p1  ORF type:complete len:129 (-),score=22.46 TRINITY_DN1733_c0_g1_i2:256-615(-)
MAEKTPVLDANALSTRPTLWKRVLQQKFALGGMALTASIAFLATRIIAQQKQMEFLTKEYEGEIGKLKAELQKFKEDQKVRVGDDPKKVGKAEQSTENMKENSTGMKDKEPARRKPFLV